MAGRLNERVAAEAREIQKQQDVPGMALAVVVEGKQFVYPFGVRAKDSPQPVTGETIFELGSVRKVFTSLLVGYAQAQGKLELAALASRC